ncbi:lipid-A-disaccharide synthase [Legionella pneumophila]|uniref:lipid-A-disaccharide synthase N-terminal domain-containing protein n=1 Tax=Legionella pneumophila TaxID=446 RepID=UPI000770B30F|nr:lipid-A-disaccharide synthase N-terminal domain-containing protein [Legionella pneumophila]CZH81725.1 lipid-A-disaccharide synthase [Legionella pneumophila]
MKMSEFGWFFFGLMGQMVFTARFIIQWLVSEQKKQSIIPISFWYCSLFGGLVLFIYAVHSGDPVFILGQFMGIFVYLRNLYWLRGRQ